MMNRAKRASVGEIDNITVKQFDRDTRRIINIPEKSVL
jgi:hypothetical protein